MITYIALFIFGIVSTAALSQVDKSCPLVNDPKKAIHLSHEENCGLFYTCDWGQLLLFECPQGLHFNADLSVCDWPDKANCKVEDIGDVVEPEIENPKLDSRCPLWNDYDETIHLPHKSDCSLFYKCDWGEAVLHKCPGGLHFNAELSVCDWPRNAKCEFDGSKPTAVVEQSTKNPDKMTVKPKETTADLEETTIHSEETTINLKETTTILEETTATPEQTTMNLEITSAAPEETTTTPEKTTSIFEETSITPEESTKNLEITSATPEETTKTAENETTPPKVEIPSIDTKCSSENDLTLSIHLPHENDCTLFYKCNWGEAILQECPGGLHFNPKLSVCDWPKDANCETNKPEKVEEESSGDIEDPELDSRCPMWNDYDFTVHLQHEQDCTLFYKCDWGEAVLHECPGGLHFNVELSLCDWPQNANCKL